MDTKMTARIARVAVMAGALILSGCAIRSGAAAAAPAGATTPVATAVTGRAQQPKADAGGAGDIPDSQVFVPYRSAAGGYQLEVPEGWARTETGANVTFTSQFNGVQVTITDSASQPSAASVRVNEVPALGQSGQAVRVTAVKDVTLPGGPAVLIRYTASSDRDPVTGKQVRLEVDRYLFFNNGRLATLTMWAPDGADNVDQWARIAGSFRWV